MPVLDRPLIIWFALLYFAVVFVIGAWALRKTRDLKDFFIAGQRIGLLVTALATTSAAFSGFVFLGGPGLTYRIGVSSFFICSSVSFTAGLLCWNLAKRLRLLAETRPILTVPDVLQCRYASRSTAGLGALAILLGTIGYLGAQFLALGRLIEAVFATSGSLGEWSLATATAIGLVVILLYSVMGGMIAGVYTDVFQGLLMVVAAAAVFWTALQAGGGFQTIVSSIEGSDGFGRAFLEPFGTVPAATALGFFFVFSVGTLGQPHMLHKFFMLDDPRKLKWMPLAVSGSQTLCILLWVGLGLAVPALVAQGKLAPLTIPDQAAPRFLLAFGPDWLTGMVLAAILSAIMSTADSFVNIGAAVLVRDLPKALGKSPARSLRSARWAVVGIAVVSALAGYFYDDLIALLGTFAFGTFAAGLVPALAIGLNWQRVTPAAASASIIVGAGSNLLLEVANRTSLFGALFARGALPSAIALALSVLTLFFVTWGRNSATQQLNYSASRQ